MTRHLDGLYHDSELLWTHGEATSSMWRNSHYGNVGRTVVMKRLSQY